LPSARFPEKNPRERHKSDAMDTLSTDSSERQLQLLWLAARSLTEINAKLDKILARPGSRRLACAAC
jgi:hypothetical protein